VTRGRRVEDDGRVLAPVHEVADGGERGDLVDAGRGERDHLAHRLAVELHLEARAARQLLEQLVRPLAVALLQLLEARRRVDLLRVQVQEARHAAPQLAHLLAEAVRERVRRVGREDEHARPLISLREREREGGRRGRLTHSALAAEDDETLRREAEARP
jgi:hypothetical protein